MKNLSENFLLELINQDSSVKTFMKFKTAFNSLYFYDEQK